jgi:CheY-like chemotaxis protein
MPIPERPPSTPPDVDETAVTRRLKIQRPARPEVVVVDDSFDSQVLLCNSLEWAGYTALGARNGEDALRLLASRPSPALIIVDLMMPIMDGIEFLHILRRYTRLARVPVIVISASERPADLDRDTVYLQKPFGEEALLDHIRRALQASPP